jgi:ribosomally synthesized peptide (two-chain TOMM family)
MSWCIPVNPQDDGSREAVTPAGGVAGGFGGVTGSDFRPGALESSLHWQVIWPRVIARAWEDPEFHEEVKADPRETIKKYFGYLLSENLQLTIKDAPEDATFKPEDNDPTTPEDPWSKLPPLELTVVIPPAPTPQLQAVAITAYQDTGRTYPFTCC